MRSRVRRAGARVTVAGAVALALAAGGCGSDDGGGEVGGAGSDSPVTAPSSTSAAPEPTGARLVEPAAGLQGVTLAAVDSVVIVDETTLEVRFYNGVEPCYGVDHATAEETPEAVILEVGVGSNPDAGVVACIELAELQAVRVPLREPIEDRAVLDLSTGQPVPATEAG